MRRSRCTPSHTPSAAHGASTSAVTHVGPVDQPEPGIGQPLRRVDRREEHSAGGREHGRRQPHRQQVEADRRTAGVGGEAGDARHHAGEHADPARRRPCLRARANEHARCARNASVITPTKPAIALELSTPNSSKPITMPASPDGSKHAQQRAVALADQRGQAEHVAHRQQRQHDRRRLRHRHRQRDHRHGQHAHAAGHAALAEAYQQRGRHGHGVERGVGDQARPAM